MNTRRLISGIVLMIGTVSLFAQGELDALRHSQYGLSGSARALGMGGAFSAIGADVASGTLNPAGFGVYRSSSFVISPTLLIAQSQTDYLNATGTGSRSNFRLPSMGVVFQGDTYYDPEETDPSFRFKSYAFAIGYNQVENYRQNILVNDAYNPASSIAMRFAERAQGLDPDELGSVEALAFNLLVIDTIRNQGGDAYFSAFNRGQINQTLQRLESGTRNEWYVSLAGNINDKLYLGGSINVMTVRYEQEFFFSETDVDNLYEVYDPFGNFGFPLEIPSNELRYTDAFSTRGSGLNARAGLIFRPVDAIRIGLSGQTPTFLSLTDNYQSSLTHNLTLDPGVGPEEYEQSTANGEFSYTLRTPYKLTAGLVWIAGKRGLVSADVDYTDIGSARLSSAESSISNPAYYGFEVENDNIRSLYQASLNYRVGGELRMDPFRLRAGAAIYGTPLSESGQYYDEYTDNQTITQETFDASRKFFTGGAGFRQPNFALDVSYVNARLPEKFSPYTLTSTGAFQPTVLTQRVSHQVTMTMAFMF
ncbi:MAG: hypothetical protein SF053_05060 [Bacteroidia bacterium]|nr:hypothetical protein [Bacteroidia bacterium]